MRLALVTHELLRENIQISVFLLMADALRALGRSLASNTYTPSTAPAPPTTKCAKRTQGSKSSVCQFSKGSEGRNFPAIQRHMALNCSPCGLDPASQALFIPF